MAHLWYFLPRWRSQGLRSHWYTFLCRLYGFFGTAFETVHFQSLSNTQTFYFILLPWIVHFRRHCRPDNKVTWDPAVVFEIKSSSFIDRIWFAVLIFTPDSTVYFLSMTKYFLLLQWERGKAQNLIGLAGLFFYTFICILLSKAPYKINWRPVLWGYFTQLVLGILVLRTTAGYIAFKEDFSNHKLLRDHHQGPWFRGQFGRSKAWTPSNTEMGVTLQSEPNSAYKINMKSHLSGWETKLHSFYLSQIGSCSKITL